MTPVVLRCTDKLAKLGGVRLSALAEPATEGWSEWYGNLLWLDRRKCVLIAHAETLFSFLVAGVLKGDVSRTGPFLVSRVEFELATEELPEDLFGRLDPDAVQIARTSSRSVLGSMNDLALQWKRAVEMTGGLESTDVAGTNRRLRRMPMGAIGHARPIDLARERARR
jgi:hypothetical protein